MSDQGVEFRFYEVDGPDGRTWYIWRLVDTRNRDDIIAMSEPEQPLVDVRLCGEAIEEMRRNCDAPIYPHPFRVR